MGIATIASTYRPFLCPALFYSGSIYAFDNWDIYEATDDGTPSSWTVKDASNAPTSCGFYNLNTEPAFLIDGTDLHIVVCKWNSGNSEWDYYYHQYDLSTDTWTYTDELIGSGQNLNSSTYQFPGIAYSGSAVYVCAYGQSDSVMGTAYTRVAIYKRTGVNTWSETPIADGATYQGVHHSWAANSTRLWTTGAFSAANQSVEYVFSTDALGTIRSYTPPDNLNNLLESKCMYTSGTDLYAVYAIDTGSAIMLLSIKYPNSGTPSTNYNKSNTYSAVNNVGQPYRDSTDAIVYVPFRDAGSVPRLISYDEAGDTWDEILTTVTDSYDYIAGQNTVIDGSGTNDDFIVYSVDGTTIKAEIRWWNYTASSNTDFSFALTSPSSTFAAAIESGVNIETLSFALTSPLSEFVLDFVVPFIEFSGLGLNYAVEETVLSVQSTKYICQIDTGSGIITIPMIRLTIRETAEIDGKTLITANIPRQYSTTVLSNIGNRITIYQSNTVSGTEVLLPVGTALITRGLISVEIATLFAEELQLWPLNYGRVITIENGDVIYWAADQVRTIFNKDIVPGLSINVFGTDKEVVSVTKYFEYDRALIEVLM